MTMMATPTQTKENFLNYMLGRLSELEGLSFRKMTGGIAFAQNGYLFGAIVGGQFRLRTPEVCQQTQSESSYLFADWAKAYCEVPEQVIADKKQLMAWVMLAVELAKNTHSDNS